MANISKHNQAQLSAFLEGKSGTVYAFFGSHSAKWGRGTGVMFRVWAPEAQSVSVVGEFNSWKEDRNPMVKVHEAGVFECYIPTREFKEHDVYQYSILTRKGERLVKADPYAYCREMETSGVSRYVDLESYEWRDKRWQRAREKQEISGSPLNIYQVHLDSWRRYEDNSPFGFKQLSEELIPYAKEMGYTHIELLPIMEYSAQSSLPCHFPGFFALSSRYGSPRDFMEFVDRCHTAGMGVILNWECAGFPQDDQGLALFDGSPCYERGELCEGEQKASSIRAFDYSRNEVKSFLFSSACMWLEKYHVDGLRIGALEPMLYLDYGLDEGQWIPNGEGGNVNKEGLAFIQELVTRLSHQFPYALLIAEERSGWPMVTKPVEAGGLGFDLKWNTEWRNDLLTYLSIDPLFRSDSHDKLTFSFLSASTENHLLPLGSDVVSRGQGSLIDKMAGGYEQKFATLRAFYGYMAAHPGKKLLFMGQEFGQFSEWNPQRELDWMLLDYDYHRALKNYVKDLNHFYLRNRPLYERDDSWEGFQWIANDDYAQNIIAFRRIGEKEKELIVVCNFAPVTRRDYRIGVPYAGEYEEVFNSDRREYLGSGEGNFDVLRTDEICMHGLEQSLSLTIPPMSVLFLMLKKRQDSRVEVRKNGVIPIKAATPLITDRRE